MMPCPLPLVSLVIKAAAMDFDGKLLTVLRRSLEDRRVQNFLQLGDSARFIRDTQLDSEDIVYILKDISQIFNLKTPRGKPARSFWKLSLFRSRTPRYEISDFTIAELRSMVASGRWSPSVFVELH